MKEVKRVCQFCDKKFSYRRVEGKEILFRGPPCSKVKGFCSVRPDVLPGALRDYYDE